MRRLLLALALFFVVATIAGLLALYLADDFEISGDRTLAWHMDRRIVDYAPRPDWPWGVDEQESSLIRIYQALESARVDSSVRGLALYVHNARFGLAKAQQIRRQLELLRDAGKSVDCYLETAGEGSNGTLSYYVASACQTIHLAPGGDLNLLGLLAERMYMRGTLDKLKIDPDFVHVGRYKSAVESYTRTESSEEAEEALAAVLDDYFDHIVTAIADARGIDEAELRLLIDSAPYSSTEALDLGLVDALSFPDEFDDFLDEQSGGEAALVSLQSYAPGPSWDSGKKIAVVFAQGVIRRGHGGAEPWTGEMYIGSRDFGKLLRDLAEDRSIDAVVLRIDSPGGSALASDLILREVELLAEEKPLVVSMSDVAASGGYYIASKAQQIIAEELTLTGSIGVYGGKLVTRRFQEELLGLTHDPMKRGEHADIYSSLEPFTPAQAERVEALMKRVYDTFIAHVASGREMAPDAVEEVAQGRVWTGGAALDVGLVDALGGFDRSLGAIREELGLDERARLRLELHPRPPDLFDYLVGRAQPFLPIEIPAPIRALREEHFDLLQLPSELVDLANPF